VRSLWPVHFCEVLQLTPFDTNREKGERLTAHRWLFDVLVDYRTKAASDPTCRRT
jgi:hypothetical protein